MHDEPWSHSSLGANMHNSWQHLAGLPAHLTFQFPLCRQTYPGKGDNRLVSNREKAGPRGKCKGQEPKLLQGGWVGP